MSGDTEKTGTVVIDYTNWRGERSVRHVWPVTMHFGSNEWHREPQWLMDAFDFAKQERRTFAMSGIHSWTPTTDQPVI